MPEIRSQLLVVAFFCLAACATPDKPSHFEHAVAGDVRPWRHENFDNNPDKFTFAVFSDLTGGEREGVFEVAVEQLNLLRPELIVNVGDLIEGESVDLQEIDAQWDSFDARAGKALAPVFYVGGNHDLSGEFLQGVWDDRLGKRYYHFVYKNVLFLVLDTEDNTPERSEEIFELRNAAIEVAETEGWDAFAKTEYANIPENAGGNIGDAQAEYFENIIAQNAAVRWTFLFMHKAAWERGEDSGFVRIETALKEQPYTVFHGHKHAYEYLERFGRDYIRLATTGGVFLPDNGRSMDHVTLVTVDNDGVDIANLLMSGILDKTGHIPANGDEICFELLNCNDSKKD
ncbi:MAG: metallophosphoesterase family protein [Woeseiaceae bacterium]